MVQQTAMRQGKIWQGTRSAVLPFAVAAPPMSVLTPKIGTTQVFRTIWADRSDLLYKLVRPVRKNLSNHQLDCTIA